MNRKDGRTNFKHAAEYIELEVYFIIPIVLFKQ